MEEQKQKKKVLIITYRVMSFLQPSLRLLGLTRYLPEYGWEPIVLAPLQPGENDLRCSVVETTYNEPLHFWRHLLRSRLNENASTDIVQHARTTSSHRYIDQVIRLAGSIIDYPDTFKGWRSPGIQRGKEIVQMERIDALISSSAPVTSHIIAREIKRQTSIPWVADFRDLWTQNQVYSHGPIRKIFESRLEKNVISTADALVTVSVPLTDKLARFHKRDRGVYSIPNGFEIHDANPVSTTVRPVFSITYTGRVYPQMNPKMFFKALCNLISENTIKPEEIEVNFYGPYEDWVQEEINVYGLSHIVRQHGVIPRHEAIKRQAESQLLLLLKWQDPQELGIYSGKVFEYLAAQRPILAVGGVSDVVDDLMNETNAGLCVSRIEDIKAAIMEFYQEYKLTGQVTFQGSQSKINTYSHQEMAHRFSNILNSLI